MEGLALVEVLKSLSEKVHTKILSNLSARAAKMIREDICTMGPVHQDDIDGAREKMLEVVRKLLINGELRFGGVVE